MRHGRTYYFRVLLGYICSLLLSFRCQRIQPGAERAAANFLHDSLELTPIQPNSTALMAAIKRETLEGVSLKRAGTFGTASRRFHSFDLSQLLAELFQHFPILLGKVNVFLGSLHKSHSVAKSILFGFHIAPLHGFHSVTNAALMPAGVRSYVVFVELGEGDTQESGASIAKCYQDR
jgi:hypothetical protein